MRYIRLIFCSLLVLLSGVAHASFPASSDPSICTVAPCYQYKIDDTGNGGPVTAWLSSSAAAGGAWASAWNSMFPCSASFPRTRMTFVSSIETSATFSMQSIEPGTCVLGAGSNTSRAVTRQGIEPVPPSYTCPANSTLSGNQCTCSAGYDQSGSSCVAHVNACTPKAGKPGITNWTLGYTRTYDEDDVGFVGGINEAPYQEQICDAGCKVDLSGPVDVWKSQEATDQGLYRVSVDIASVPTGQECSPAPSDAPASKTTPSPACPGFVGEINGVKGCYGTASKPVAVVQGSRPPETPQPGNPAAGEKPATGEGSGSTGAGRTPAAGSGGNAGGPASSAVNAKGDGTTTKPAEGKEQQACGAPGQPKCGIDETGTPGDAGTSFDAAKTALDTNKDAVKTAIDGAASMQAPIWTFSFALPTGCTAYNTGIKDFVMNPCQYQSTIHDLMSMVWAAVTVFCIIGMVGRTIRES